MTKVKTAFVCQQCGYRAPKWLGRCTECGEFNSLVEEIQRPTSKVARPVLSDENPTPITEVQSMDRPRIITGIGELDRVFGSGVVVGSVSLFGGDPGIGKSTLILQVCEHVARAGHTVLYVSSEESVVQTKLRADRLGVGSENLFVVSETNAEVIRSHIESMKPALAVIDSIQMIYRPEIPSAPGTVGQVRECSAELAFVAKRLGISLFIIGHVTKDGSIAGPKTLEHLVDAVFYFEGDRFQTFRILRGVKNRFGSTNEIGIFEMRSEGLVEVTNPSEMFMSSDRKERVGSVVVPSIIGSRTLLVEVQALTARSSGGYPARRVTGVDLNRVSLIIAVLERRTGFSLGWQDVFVNAVGGVQIEEPAADLAVAVAIASSFRGAAVDAKTFAVGELGLSGEVRGVAQAGARVIEGQRLGFTRALVPRDNLRAIGSIEGLEIVPVSNLREALESAGVV